MNRLVVVSLAALALAGCKVKEPAQENAAAGGEVALSNASAAEVAAEVRAAGGGGAMELTPGQWETTAEVVTMDMPGLPKGPAGEQALAAIKGNPVTIRHCIKPEQARKPDASMFAGKGAKGCTFADFAMGGGKVSGTMTCASEQGGTMTNKFAGSFQGDSMAVEMEMTTAGPMGQMVMKMKQSGRRIGDCPA